MDIADAFRNIPLPLNDIALEPPLPNMANIQIPVPIITAIRQKHGLHDLGNGMTAVCLKDKMKMVIHEDKGVKLKRKSLPVFFKDINEQDLACFAVQNLLLVIAA